MKIKIFEKGVLSERPMKQSRLHPHVGQTAFCQVITRRERTTGRNVDAGIHHRRRESEYDCPKAEGAESSGGGRRNVSIGIGEGALYCRK